MHLTRDEEKAIKGEYGEYIASAYRILLAIGEAGVKFLEEFSKDSRVSVITTLNPMGFDRRRVWDLPSEQFVLNQMRILKSYEKIGAVPSFTCIPYEVIDIPKRGSVVSVSESNAAVFSNSVLG